MEGMDRSRLWKSLKQKFGLKRMGCCGAIFGPGNTATAANPGTSTITIIETLHIGEDDVEETSSRRSCGIPYTSQDVPSIAMASGMNLAMALAAERDISGAGHSVAVGRVKTLMALIEETDGVDLKVGKRVKRRHRQSPRSGAEAGVGAGVCDGVCCVCMERSKGAAFIPCGHTFCRPCSRELWISRRSCPVCNRSILEILDIF